MDSITLRSRLLKLLQKSRKASRLYGAVDSRTADFRSTDYKETDVSKGQFIEPKEMQAREWKIVTSELLQELSATLENPNPKRLLQQAFSMRDRFYSDFRMSESDLNRLQRELVNASEVSDFVRALSCARDLIKLKAKTQATQAAYHELAEILSRAKNPNDEQELIEQQIILKEEHDDIEAASSNKVIPLRQKRVVSAY